MLSDCACRSDLASTGNWLQDWLTLFGFVPGGLSPIAGAILARENGDYLGMKIFAGVVVLIGTTGVLFAKLAQSGWKLMAKF